ncbi:uncharacterized protein LOC101746969 [Bombyx mori]|uniref:RNA exonuclease 4 n=1 Tax=Bombyx mori TaxID=7091 RepID=A0A8R2GB21_BOMMO|nr:RNA exonuclease 4 [Bombyx mori]
MSNANATVIAILYSLIFIFTILYLSCNSFVTIVRSFFNFIFGINMVENSHKRKRTASDDHNQTVSLRGLINANWQKLLASNLLMDHKEEKQAPKEQYTGKFRRNRKTEQKINKSKDLQPTVRKFETLNLEPDQADGHEDDIALNDRKQAKNKITKFIAMDCEMVGIGYDGNDHMLARVSLVNKFGDCIYDKFVKPREEVKDYRTIVSGIRKEDLINGEDFSIVQKEVADVIRGKILVGHSLKNDLNVLFLSHPKRNIRDTSKYKPFKKITKGSTPSLKRLAKEILSIDIQHGEHSSVEDARAAMQLYRTVSKKWEAGLSDRRGYKKINE